MQPSLTPTPVASSIARASEHAASVTTRELSEFERDLLLQTNILRSRGTSTQRSGTTLLPASPVVWNHRLAAAAREHARDMAETRRLNHIDSRGRTPEQRLDAVGYLWSACSENLLYGDPSGEACIEAWRRMRSGQCEILMRPWTEMGAAYYRGYVVQIFARPRHPEDEWTTPRHAAAPAAHRPSLLRRLFKRDSDKHALESVYVTPPPPPPPRGYTPRTAAPSRHAPPPPPRRPSARDDQVAQDHALAVQLQQREVASAEQALLRDIRRSAPQRTPPAPPARRSATVRAPVNHQPASSRVEPVPVVLEYAVREIDAVHAAKNTAEVLKTHPKTLAAFVAAALHATKDGLLSEDDFEMCSANVMVAVPRLAVLEGLATLLETETFPHEMYKTKEPKDEYNQILLRDELREAFIAILTGEENVALDDLLQVLRLRIADKKEAFPVAPEPLIERALAAVGKVADWPMSNASAAVNVLLQHTFEKLQDLRHSDARSRCKN